MVLLYLLVWKMSIDNKVQLQYIKVKKEMSIMFFKGNVFVRSISLAVFLIIAICIGVKFYKFNSEYISPQEEIIFSVGECECLGYYSTGFRDFTDYAIYSYNDPSIKNNENFKKATDVNDLMTYLDDYEKWVASYGDDSDAEIQKNYNFDRDIIDENDYYCIVDKSESEKNYEKFRYYDIYIFDSQSNKLYFFHENF